MPELLGDIHNEKTNIPQLSQNQLINFLLEKVRNNYEEDSLEHSNIEKIMCISFYKYCVNKVIPLLIQ